MGEPGAAHSNTILALAEGDSSHDGRARVTATGRGVVAEQIFAIAPDHGVRVSEDADLAAILTHVYRAEGAPENIAEGRPEGDL